MKAPKTASKGGTTWTDTRNAVRSTLSAAETPENPRSGCRPACNNGLGRVGRAEWAMGCRCAVACLQEIH